MLGGFEGKGININDLMARVKSPIRFRPEHGGRTAYGYEATILADLCDVILAARKTGKICTASMGVDPMGDLDRAKCRCVSAYGVIIHTDGHSIREPLGAPKRGG